MSNKLLIVESPAKARTINQYLGDDYTVLASFGHIRDLPKKNTSIDVEHDFKPDFQLVERNKKHVEQILKSANYAEEILLATDPDREGEAIAWHLQQLLVEKLSSKVKISRVVFHEITKNAILAAVQSKRSLDQDLIDAQAARLTMDFLIGFNISPLLWRKVRTGLSAGRVQSPALRLICDRETEILQFIPETYFSVQAQLAKNNKTKKDLNFMAKLVVYNNKKILTKTLVNQVAVQEIVKTLQLADQALISALTKKDKKKNPLAPYMTSSLQIDAVRKLGLSTEQVMRIAQSLYEGVDLAGEIVGLISYMRTDSVNLADSAIAEIRLYVNDQLGAQYLPKTVIKYLNKVKNAQEAHEAIRPTLISRVPAMIKAYLSSDQFKLYELIWQRTVASQMSSAIYDTLTVEITIADGIFKAHGSNLKFDGFLQVYQQAAEEQSESDENEQLPKMMVGEKLQIKNIELNQHQTEAKPRYGEASLVKSLEELGIGRPSTYASIISTLKKREYVLMDKKRFTPTEIGMMVNEFLVKHLGKYVDLQFTAKLENELDEVSTGKLAKLPLLHTFWQELKTIVDEKQAISKLELTAEKLDELCPNCTKPLLLRFGRYGKFIGCTGYPDCNYMRKQSGEIVEKKELEMVEGRMCPKDGGQLAYREGKYGKFISCINYPKCKYIENLHILTGDEVSCPTCKTGHMLMRKNRYGGYFYSCSSYPDCKTIFNHKPLKESCTECGYSILLHKITKTKGEEKFCPNCKHSQSIAAIIDQ